MSLSAEEIRKSVNGYSKKGYLNDFDTRTQEQKDAGVKAVPHDPVSAQSGPYMTGAQVAAQVKGYHGVKR